MAMEQIERVPANDATAEPQVLRANPGFKAVYSPDGMSIVFGCGGQLCTMGAGGSDVDVVVDTARLDALDSVPFAELNHFDWGPPR